jgi:hypothetical protein
MQIPIAKTITMAIGAIAIFGTLILLMAAFTDVPTPEANAVIGFEPLFDAAVSLVDLGVSNLGL